MGVLLNMALRICALSSYHISETHPLETAAGRATYKQHSIDLCKQKLLIRSRHACGLAAVHLDHDLATRTFSGDALVGAHGVLYIEDRVDRDTHATFLNQTCQIDCVVTR